MKKSTLAVLAVAALAWTALPVTAAELKVGANDTVQTVLSAQKGGRVTLRVRSGQEITGTVREVGSRVVHLGAISGKDFFDAVVPLEAVDAVFVRARE